MQRIFHRLPVIGLSVLAGLGSTAALAADKTPAPSEAVFVAELVLLLLVGRLFGEVMQRIGQPAVVGQLLAGIVLGPSVFGALLPGLQAWAFPADHAQKAMIDAVGQVGVLMLLLLTGMETDLPLVRRAGKAAFAVSITGIAVPFGLGVTLGMTILPESLLPSPDRRFVAALFLGTALSISSIKIVAMVVREMNFMRRNLGQIILASAIIDDTIGWILVAITFGLAKPGALNLGSIAVSVFGTLAFLVLSYTVGRRLVSLLIRWANDNLVSEFPVITAILIVMGLLALLTDAIGVHTVLGAFVAGVLVGESPILTRHIEQQLRGLITAFFMPVFFALAGLGTDLSILRRPELLAATLGLIAIASLGKFGGAFLGGTIGGLTRRECLALALGMNARGSTEVIVASIGLSMGVLDGQLFTMIVTMAVVTTMIMPPTLRWALERLPMGAEEAARLDREEFEDHDFVAGLERVLLAVDGSASGALAARLVGVLSGVRGLPTTVIRLRESVGEGDAETAAGSVKASADQVRAAGEAAEAGAPVDVITRGRSATRGLDAIAAEAVKGYDLAVIGLDPTEAPEGGFSREAAQAVASADGPSALVVARGALRQRPADGPMRILVPVSGSDGSRRAAEVAFALARPRDATVTVLFVAPPVPEAAGSGGGQAAGSGGGQAAALDLRRSVIADIQAIADGQGLKIRTRVRTDEAPVEAILRQARRGAHTLIVMGVSRRPGNAMLFGSKAAAVLSRAEQALVFVAG